MRTNQRAACLVAVLATAGCGSTTAETVSAPGSNEPQSSASTDTPTGPEPASPAPTNPAPPSDETSGPTSPAELCPVLADPQPIAGSGHSIAPPGVISDLDAMLAAIPTQLGPRTRAETHVIPRGTAGTASPHVAAVMAHGAEQVRVDVYDLVHVCRCHAGDGLLRRRYAVDTGGPSESLELGGWPSLVAHASGGTFVHVWVADRCQVTLEGAPEASLLEVARGLDWAALGRACGAQPRT